MPTSPTYPGVYIEEVPSGVRTITGVATSITAFIGWAPRGPLDEPVRVQNYGEYSRRFGGLHRDSMLGYAVQHYFLNGGTDALVIRVVGVGAAATRFNLPAGGGNLTLDAASAGEWGDNLQIFVDHETRDPANDDLFNLTINEVVDGATVAVETHRNLSVNTADARYLPRVLAQQSEMVVVSGAVGDRPDLNIPDGDGNPTPMAIVAPGDNGGPVGFAQIADPDLMGVDEPSRGIYALDQADLFNLLCIPPFGRATDVDATTWTHALAYCKTRRAMLIVDPPSAAWPMPSDVLDNDTGVDGQGAGRPTPARDENAAIYYPRVRMADALNDNRLETFAPCGVVAGIYARTDARRGVWKAPAGQEATLVGVRELAYKMTDGENGQLNPRGVNCLRTFPVAGNVVWGARTMEGADSLASEWKYVSVRRMALFIEESLYRGTQWVIFEPNDEPLWAQIRLNAGAFMHDLFRQGAFQGSTPKDAYLVKCDSETTTQSDINRGIVNLWVGFAPLKPAEFLIIKISQLAGNVQS